MTNQDAQRNSSNKPKTPIPFESLLDCDRPACDGFMSALKKASAASKSSGSISSQPDSSTKTSLSSNAVARIAPAVIVNGQEDPLFTTETSCPPTSAHLGRSTWTLLHTMAAWYPDQPTEPDQTSIRQFFAALGRWYPCPWCAHDFQLKLQEKPIKTDSRKNLCKWLCEQHNSVNQKLGKPEFPCDLVSLDDRWRQSQKIKCQKEKYDE